VPYRITAEVTFLLLPQPAKADTWTEIVEKDCQACKLNREDAMEHNRWKKQIRDD